MPKVATGRPKGRPAKPIERHRLDGTVPTGRPMPLAPMPGEGLKAATSVPKVSGLGKAGKELWVRLWSAGREWLSPESDYAMLLMACQAQDEAEALRVQFATGKVERMYFTAAGQYVTHPYVNQLAALRTQITSWLSAMGFSAADRARLGLAQVRIADALDELKERRDGRSTTS